MVSKIKTLVIGKDSELQRFLQQNLDDGRYEMANTEKTCEELRAVLNKEVPDIVILDIMMPTLEGIEVCLRIRQWSLIPIIMLSTWGVSEGNVRGLNLSDETYLTEPFGVEELKTRIDQALHRNFVAMTRMPDIFPRTTLERLS